MANQIVKLKKGSDYLYPYATFMGIDTTNVLVEVINQGSNYTYTATEDCFVMCMAIYLGYPKIDGVRLNAEQNSKHYGDSVWSLFPLCKGQTIELWANGYDQNYNNVKIYGIKR